MWICAKCGEPHQDQFKECWNCVGAEINEHVTATPPRPRSAAAKERRLRPLRAILLRAGIAFLFGTLLTLSCSSLVNFQAIWPDMLGMPPGERLVIGLIFGAIFGFVVGVFIWVVFPYEPPGGKSERSLSEPEHMRSQDIP